MTPGLLIVTGGGRGIGAAIARRAARDGWAVCVNYRSDAASAAAVAAEIAGAGGQAIAVAGDTSVEDDIRALFDQAEAAFGPVRGLVNNAGITGRNGPLAELEADTLRRVVDVNLIGPILCAREAVRRFRAAGTKGVIVSLSSGAAQSGSPGEYVHYAATKGAVESFTLGLGRELAAEGIRVNAVSPGMIRTGIHEPGRLDRVTARIPAGRPGEPEDVAEAVAWMLSDAARYTTATVLKVAGGL
ncbi:NAD(P)-dependent dehydrogenase (short-subunit alcohol dehydrogenase family) [Inquilinus ginsengisoli]|uniref:NAD(P)-dependent dehydrogenase (Short-subunit alcohol dehydrogenase family) n=1 Tax=Inquilinus ginsengisoli TaxID=363840 RepID=A0ABU1K016_9PROT|nr:SDR family oxidoreductase [Inquilinus ginsengisoli]MDR6294217.1 NAD(P)-dependent dehydrogenase (short-subunit alcohol dehydrogenase family) [Inquilinus ginsengisoli]